MADKEGDSDFNSVREEVEKAHQDSVDDVKEKVERAKAEALKKLHP
jgi:hypothetical protein